MQLLLQIYLYTKPFTICNITEDGVSLPDNNTCLKIGIKQDTFIDFYIPTECFIKVKCFKTSSYFLQLFVKECINSTVYRKNFLRNIYYVFDKPSYEVEFLKFKLEPPDREIIDHAWNEKILKLVWTRAEIENAFSWLSTLGGAYSALGDYFEYCAEEAGRISAWQYKLSNLLGDKALAARSKLYSALSYSQKGELKLARNIVRQVHKFAMQTQDRRLWRMCQGVWAKLKYLRRLKKCSKGVQKYICQR